MHGDAQNGDRPGQHRAGCADPAEIDLLQRVLADDDRAWTLFCRRYERLIVGCVLRVLRRYGAHFDEADLADLVGEVWLVLLRRDRRKLRQYDPSRGYRLSSWIGLIASNCTIDQLRARSVQHTYLDDSEGHEQLVDEPRAGPDARLERIERVQLANRALAQLRPDEQRFVAACFSDERNPAELAEELGVRLNTIYSRKFKLRAKLTRIASTLAADGAQALARAA